jgi:hypothetical protein
MYLQGITNGSLVHFLVTEEKFTYSITLWKRNISSCYAIAIQPLTDSAVCLKNQQMTNLRYRRKSIKHAFTLELLFDVLQF